MRVRGCYSISDWMGEEVYIIAEGLFLLLELADRYAAAIAGSILLDIGKI